MSRKIRSLLFSTLYPSAERPVHGIFVETRLRELLSLGEVDVRVVAPVPYFPSGAERWGEWGQMARTPHQEERHGITVLHPRHLVLPKVGMTLAPWLLAAASVGPIRRLIREGFDFDLIDAHYYYPDGVAAALVARHFGKPLCVTARGTDLNLIPQHVLPRHMIRWTARQAEASIGVCRALMEELGRIEPAAAGKLHVFRNGVDLQRFKPLPPAEMRQALGLQGAPVLLSVGHLIERKGHHVVIRALGDVRRAHPAAQLLVIGAGPDQGALQALAQDAGVAEAVRFTGAVPNTELARWYSAADLLVLASSREGWANVLLEAMACGTPVVATDIWGTPEVVADPAVGTLVAERTPQAFAQAIVATLGRKLDRTPVRRYAEGFGWEATSRAQMALFRRMVAGTQGTLHA